MSFPVPFPNVAEFINILKNRKLNYVDAVLQDPPAVSIVSSFYNDSEYFEDAYQSIINQTFQNYEWILVDDCSTSIDSIDLFNSLEKRNSKIRTFRHQENKGPSAGRNKAISYARGKYLFFMDTDDIIEPTYIEKCVLFLESHPEFSFVNSYSVGFQEEEYWWDKGFNTPNSFLQENLVTGRVLYKKKDFEELGGYDETMRYGEDWDLWLKAFVNHQKAYTIPEYLDCYRRKKFGLSATARQREQEFELTKNLLHSRYKKFFKNNNLPDIDISYPSSIFSSNQLNTTVGITNYIHFSEVDKKILCFLPHFKSEESNKFILKFFQELKRKEYSITLVTVLPENHSLYAQFYQITPDIFNLSNLFDCTHWGSFTKYIIDSRKIKLVFIYNNFYVYHLLPSLREIYPDVTFIDFIYLGNLLEFKQANIELSYQYSDFLDGQIVTSSNIVNYYHTPKKATNLYVVDGLQDDFCETALEQIESIFEKIIKLKLANKNKDCNWRQAIPDNTVDIWIQKYLTLKKADNQAHDLEEKIMQINQWNQKLLKEKNIYKNQAQTWMKTAKMIQLDLQKTEAELTSAQKQIAQLTNDIKKR